MYDCVAYTCGCTHKNVWFLRKPKEGSDNTALELQRTISYNVGARASELLNQLYNPEVYQVHHWKYLLRGWIESSVVENSGCSCTVSRFDSQHKHNSSEQFVTPIWGPDALFWSQVLCTFMVCVHMFKQNNHAPITNTKKYFVTSNIYLLTMNVQQLLIGVS